MTSRKCKWCNQELSTSTHHLLNFCNNKCRKKFLQKYHNQYYKKNYLKYREITLIRSRQWRENNPEYHRQYVKKLLEKKPNYFLKYGGEYKYNYCPYDGLSYNKYKKLNSLRAQMNKEVRQECFEALERAKEIRGGDE